MENEHKDLFGRNIHRPFAFEFNNENERVNANGLTQNDRFKLALQHDNNSVWLLVSITPLEWSSIGSNANGSNNDIEQIMYDGYDGINININPSSVDLVLDAVLTLLDNNTTTILDLIQSEYVLPIASSTILGGIKIGGSLVIGDNGVADLSSTYIQTLDNIINDPSSVVTYSGFTGSNITIPSDASLTDTLNSILNSLDSVLTDVNQDVVYPGFTGSNITIPSDSTLTEALDIISSNLDNLNTDLQNITIVPDINQILYTSGFVGDNINITPNSSLTDTLNSILSTIDQNSADISILTSGNTYTLPVATNTILGGIKIGSDLTIDQNGIVNITNPLTDEYINKLNAIPIDIGTQLSNKADITYVDSQISGISPIPDNILVDAYTGDHYNITDNSLLSQVITDIYDIINIHETDINNITGVTPPAILFGTSNPPTPSPDIVEGTLYFQITDIVNSVISILGPSSITENTATQYQCELTLPNGLTAIVTAEWSITSGTTFGNIDPTTGRLITNELTQDQPIIIRATYNNLTITKNITILHTGQIQSLTITGLNTLNISSSTVYTCDALYDNGQTLRVTPNWAVIQTNNLISSIDSGGLLTVNDYIVGETIINIQAELNGVVGLKSVTLNPGVIQIGTPAYSSAYMIDYPMRFVAKTSGAITNNIIVQSIFSEGSLTLSDDYANNIYTIYIPTINGIPIVDVINITDFINNSSISPVNAFLLSNYSYLYNHVLNIEPYKYIPIEFYIPLSGGTDTLINNYQINITESINSIYFNTVSSHFFGRVDHPIDPELIITAIDGYLISKIYFNDILINEPNAGIYITTFPIDGVRDVLVRYEIVESQSLFIDIPINNSKPNDVITYPNLSSIRLLSSRTTKNSIMLISKIGTVYTCNLSETQSETFGQFNISVREILPITTSINIL